MAYAPRGKGAATGYTAFNKGASGSGSDYADTESTSSSTTNDAVKQRKLAIKRRLLSMKGN